MQTNDTEHMNQIKNSNKFILNNLFEAKERAVYKNIIYQSYGNITLKRQALNKN